LAARNNPQDDAEVIARPQPDTDFRNFRGVIDTGAPNPFLQPSPSSFNVGFFDSFDDLFRRLRTRLWPAINVDSADTPGSDDSNEEGLGLGFGLRPLITIPKIPENGNTTSTIKVVDGHKVEINETVYGDTNSVFKVRVVNVRPLESGEEVAEGVHSEGGKFQPAAATPSGSPTTSGPPKAGEFDDEVEENSRREPLEKQPSENEVRDIDEPKSTTTTPSSDTTRKVATTSPADSEPEASDLSEEIMDAPSAHELNETMDHLQEMMQKEFELLEAEKVEQDPEDKESLPLKQKKEREEFDSSDDEDVETTTPVEMSETFNEEWSEFDHDQDQDNDQDRELDVETDAGNELDNDIAIEENFVPVDLSNDIAVNDFAAADPDFPLNPDAEVIVAPTVFKAMPMFEKLTLGQPSK
ncbi:hypothetical protein KR018_012209, partial [Drosophila ironensis]